ncbi:MAG: porin [Phycisphaerae bacterium]
MPRNLNRICLIGAASAWLSTGVALGEDTTSESETQDSKIARLEALLEAQQRRIDSLARQVGSSEQQQMDAARVEEMKRQIREVLSEREFRESLMPSTLLAGYDNGFYIGSSDEKFMLKLNGDMQVRWTYYHSRDTNRYLLPGVKRDDRSGFDLQRLRLNIGGYAYNKDLTYDIQIRADAPDNYDAVIQYAWVNYRVADEFNIQAGIFQTADRRSQQLADNGLLQFVDRGLVDATFGFGNGLGIRLWGHLFDKRFCYFVDVVNSLGGHNNRTITTDPAERDSNPAIIGRAVWHILGDPGKDGCALCAEFSGEGDLRKDKSQPLWDFGFDYAFDENSGDNLNRFAVPLSGWHPGVGGFGLVSSRGTQMNQFGFDTGLKWMGFSMQGEYVIRLVDPRATGNFPFAPWWVASGDESTTAQHGGYVQLGYMLPIPGFEDKIELVARVGGVSALAEHQEGTWEYAGGVNYYIEGHKVKLQADVVKVSEVPISSSYSSLANVNDDALIFRMQLQFSF